MILERECVVESYLGVRECWWIKFIINAKNSTFDLVLTIMPVINYIRCLMVLAGKRVLLFVPLLALNNFRQ